MIDSSSVMLPRLLTIKNKRIVSEERLSPDSLSIDLKIDVPSTAEMSIEGEKLHLRDWVELFTIHGSAGIFRVSAIEYSHETNTQLVSLEHGIAELNDYLYPIPPAPDPNSYMSMWGYLPEQHIAHYLSGYTGMWKLGTVDAITSVDLSYDNTTAFESLKSLMSELSDYMLTFDQSSIPWTFNVVEKPKFVTAEGRLTRNLSSVRSTYDTSDLCTRVYANGLHGGFVYEDADDKPYGYMQDDDAVAKYGVVSQHIDLSEGIDREQAERIARRYLDKRCKPSVSIEIEALDLSAATGEEFDSFTLGKRFRLTMPDYGVVEEEQIVGISYSNVFGDPERVTLSLSSEMEDLSEVISIIQSSAKAAKSAYSSSKQKAEQVEQIVTKLEYHDSLWLNNNKVLIDAGIFVHDPNAPYDKNAIVIADTAKHIGELETRLEEAGIIVKAVDPEDPTKSALVTIFAQETFKQGIFDEVDTMIESAGITVDTDSITSSVTQTIRNEITNEKTTIGSQIKQTVNSITQSVVNDKGLVTKTELTDGSFKVSAENVEVDSNHTSIKGYIDAHMENLGQLTTGGLIVNGECTLNTRNYGLRFTDADGTVYNVKWQSKEIATGITQSSSNTEYSVKAPASAGGNTIGYVTIPKITYTANKTTIYYLGHT